MRFRSDVYDKVFPRPVAREVVEAAVPTFTPTQDIIDQEESVKVEPAPTVVTTDDVIEPITDSINRTEGGEYGV